MLFLPWELPCAAGNCHQGFAQDMITQGMRSVEVENWVMEPNGIQMLKCISESNEN